MRHSGRESRQIKRVTRTTSRQKAPAPFQFDLSGAKAYISEHGKAQNWYLHAHMNREFIARFFLSPSHRRLYRWLLHVTGAKNEAGWIKPALCQAHIERSQSPRRQKLERIVRVGKELKMAIKSRYDWIMLSLGQQYINSQAGIAFTHKMSPPVAYTANALNFIVRTAEEMLEAEK